MKIADFFLSSSQDLKSNLFSVVSQLIPWQKRTKMTEEACEGRAKKLTIKS